MRSEPTFAALAVLRAGDTGGDHSHQLIAAVLLVLLSVGWGVRRMIHPQQRRQP